MLLQPNSVPNSTDSHRYCRQVSIESPGTEASNFVFNCEVPVPDVPPQGARIKVVCAGACYRNRNRLPSAGSQATIPEEEPSQTNYGIRDSALFPGYEVSGVIDELGSEVSIGSGCGLTEGQRVVLYPHDAIPHGYSDYVVVSDLQFVIPVPDNLPLSVAAMLPTGALLGKNAVLAAHDNVLRLLEERPDQDVKILVVGTGGLALWAIRIAAHHFGHSGHRDRVKVTVACMRDEGFAVAKSIHNVNLVQWSEDLYENQIIERTTNACNGLVDIVIDFGTTARTLNRSLQCLNRKGVVLVNQEVAERLLPRFSPIAEQKEQKIQAVAKGDVEQLKELVELVSSGEIVPPPHTVFPADQACSVVQKLSKSEIPGRAILRFHDIE
ncbi:uncharacterized protein Drat [Atheta coriaria]|uniref:uncharacterized protein Drat n=1 Tax=Dalotia coriaria TaxID=877792 RepID=UPI0031F43469